ncbi:MAG: TPM domain-containing protein [Dehalogenimonas sp.]|uniref:TPM domain-containing protein n=1 Tax=Candidatus Dehalogenimonas loeffleri TaxID=3127115 RepID=A0ABZ2J2C9_9CHLR|nr:TPM domain-containing protein [Dehalogenimonas sp.]
MRRLVLTSLTVAALLLGGTVAVWAQPFPPPQGFVSDFAGVIDADTRSALENRLTILSQETGAEIAVVTIASLEGDTIENYAVRLFEAWGIGQADADNGVLFITAVADHKVRIEVGYGLEPIITDGRAGRILDDYVLPSFRVDDYAAGIADGVAALEELIRAGTPPSLIEENPIRDIFGEIESVIFGIGFITMYLLAFMARTRSIWLGGIWGAIAGVVIGLATGNIWALVGLTIGLAVSGLFLDALLSRNYQTRSSNGLPTSWSSSGGGFRSSSSHSSGFGGFSGGSSGGGGASRGW